MSAEARPSALRDPSDKPSPHQRHVHFAEYTLTHEYYDEDFGWWVNYGMHPTVRMSQVPAGYLFPMPKPESD